MYDTAWFFTYDMACAFAASCRMHGCSTQVKYNYGGADMPNWQVIWW
jgi:hypothetical protein